MFDYLFSDLDLFSDGITTVATRDRAARDAIATLTGRGIVALDAVDAYRAPVLNIRRGTSDVGRFLDAPVANVARKVA